MLLVGSDNEAPPGVPLVRKCLVTGFAACTECVAPDATDWNHAHPISESVVQPAIPHMRVCQIIEENCRTLASTLATAFAYYASRPCLGTFADAGETLQWLTYAEVGSQIHLLPWRRSRLTV